MPARIQEFADWVAALEVDAIPDRVLERARLQAMNTVAAGLAGSTAPAVARLREATSYWAAPGSVGVIGTDDEWEPAAAAYANAAASMAHDWDDYLYMGHTGHSAVWAARALTDDAERALVAQVAGNELAGRLGAALFLGPHNGQFWASIHCAGAAASAGVALGLDAEGLAHALAIALYQPPYGLMPGFMGPPTKLLTAAAPAAGGVQAALLAADGVTGALDVIEAPDGLLRHFAYAPRPGMLGALGDVWLTDTLAYKPRPGCAYVQAAVDAALQAAVEADDVARVTVDAGLLTVAMEREGARAGLTAVGVNFSVARSIAVALLAQQLTAAELAPAWLAEHAAAIEDLAARVRVRHDWALSLESARGVVDAGASMGALPPSAIPALVRRVRELGDLRGRAERTVAADAWRLIRRARAAGEGIGSLDTARLRLTFPCRVRLELRSGRRLEIDGREEGSSGAPVEEQRAVVAAKEALVGGQALA